jgi:DNA-directed RNA polymerase subunit RPC12/RpoP
VRKKGEIKYFDGVAYEVKRRSRYSDDFYYCSNCALWLRRLDLKEIKRCPDCNRRVRFGGLEKEKRYISVEIDLEG